MVAKAKTESEPKRRNRAVSVSEALGPVLDSALRKRGFATRDILSQWAAMAPKPYDLVAVPDQLKWPRGPGAEGATLYLRCAQSHALALSHEGPLIASAVNRYFGYFLVRDVRLAVEPFSPGSPARASAAPMPPDAIAGAGRAVSGVDDLALKDALRSLGEAVLSKSARKHVTKP